MIIDKNVNYIFDFDGTIVDLKVDWKKLKKEINEKCIVFDIDINKKLNIKIDSLKKKGIDIMDILKKYEQPNDKVIYTIKQKTIAFIENLNEFYVVSNNLNSTIKKVFDELGFRKKCKMIIAIDDVKQSKPSNESFELLEQYLINKKSLYIGDRETDKEFAQSCNIKFRYVDLI